MFIYNININITVVVIVALVVLIVIINFNTLAAGYSISIVIHYLFFCRHITQFIATMKPTSVR